MRAWRSAAPLTSQEAARLYLGTPQSRWAHVLGHSLWPQGLKHVNSPIQHLPEFLQRNVHEMCDSLSFSVVLLCVLPIRPPSSYCGDLTVSTFFQQLAQWWPSKSSHSCANPRRPSQPDTLQPRHLQFLANTNKLLLGAMPTSWCLALLVPRLRLVPVLPLLPRLLIAPRLLAARL